MWVLEENLLPFLTTIGWIVGYTFDQDDWTAISNGIGETDQEADRWYEYEMAGRRRLKLAIARDPGSSVVFVRVQTEAVLESQVNLAIEIFARFRLRT